MYSGTRVCAGHAHWQSTTLWKYLASVSVAFKVVSRKGFRGNFSNRSLSGVRWGYAFQGLEQRRRTGSPSLLDSIQRSLPQEKRPHFKGFLRAFLLLANRDDQPESRCNLPTCPPNRRRRAPTGVLFRYRSTAGYRTCAYHVSRLYP
jgi:hypothetical protein